MVSAPEIGWADQWNFPLLEPAVVQPEPVVIPSQDLDAAVEHEQCGRKGVQFESMLNQRRQTVD